MQPRISVVTLGVSDLEQSRTFYESGLGWTVSSRSQDNIVFFQLGTIVLALYPEPLLAEDATVPADDRTGFRGITLAHNVRTQDEVEEVLQAAARAGGTIVKPAQATSWGGFAGYFADPDQHLWEVCHNPFWELTEDGALILPTDEG